MELKDLINEQINSAEPEELLQLSQKINEKLKELEKEKEKIDLAEKSQFIGKCYKGYNKLIKILSIDEYNVYRTKCLMVFLGNKKEDFFISFRDEDLFCNNPYDVGKKVIDSYTEISEENFKKELFSKIEEFCFNSTDISTI